MARFELKVLNVNEEFEFRARGGDDVTDWVKVELVDPPMLTKLDLVVTPPQYMQQPSETLPAGQGPYYVFTGSQLAISGTSNKPITRAVLKVRGTATQWPMELDSPTSVTAIVPFGELMDGKYEIQLVDESGLTAKRPTAFGIRLKLDRAPRVPSFRLHGITRLVVPNARIPMTAQVLDDFAVTKVALGFELRGELGDLTKATGAVDFPSVDDQLGSKDVVLDDVWELKTLDLPTGITLTLRVLGEDNDEVTPDKQPGKSKERLLRVVTEEELRTDLLRREKEMREELSRLLELQEQLLTDCRALRAELGDEPSLTAKQKAKLLAIRRQQTLLGNNIDSVAERLDDFILEVLNNQLEEEGGPLQERLLTKVIRPLRTAVEVENHNAEVALDQARQAASQPTERNPALEKAAEEQAKIVEVLREVLVHMVKAEGYQEAVNALYQIEKAEKGVLEATKKSWQELIKRLLEEGKIEAPTEQPK